jgi:hypothetical protein
MGEIYDEAMKKHVKIYMDHFGYGEQDVIPCEACTRPAVDIHHIKYKSRGGKDEIANLCALCRKCHIMAHNEELSESDLLYIHRSYMATGKTNFIK